MVRSHSDHKSRLEGSKASPAEAFDILPGTRILEIHDFHYNNYDHAVSLRREVVVSVASKASPGGYFIC